MKERVKKLCHKKKLLHMFQRPFKTAVSRKAFSHIPKATHAYCECKEYIPYFLGDQVLLTPVNQSLVPLDTRLLCLRELRSPHGVPLLTLLLTSFSSLAMVHLHTDYCFCLWRPAPLAASRIWMSLSQVAFVI
jgi:hypothetical protein